MDRMNNSTGGSCKSGVSNIKIRLVRILSLDNVSRESLRLVPKKIFRGKRGLPLCCPA